MGPRPINSFISLQLALPNGRAEEIKRIEGPCGGELWMNFFLFSFSFGWIKGAGTAHGSAKEREQTQQTNRNESMKQRKRKVAQFVFADSN